MASNDNKEENWIQRTQKFASNAAVQAAATASLLNPAFAITPSAIPAAAQDPHTGKTELLAQNSGDVNQKVWLRQGDVLTAPDGTQHKAIGNYSDTFGRIDDKGNVLTAYITDEQGRLMLIHNDKLLWYQGQTVSGLEHTVLTGYYLTKKGDVYFSVSEYPQKGKHPQSVVYHNDQVVFDSRKLSHPERFKGFSLDPTLIEPGGTVNGKPAPRNLPQGTVVDLDYTYSVDNENGSPVMKSLVLEQKAARLYNLERDPNPPNYVFGKILSDKNALVSVVGKEPVKEQEIPTATQEQQEPKIYNIFVGGFFDDSTYQVVKNYVHGTLDGSEDAKYTRSLGLTKDAHNVVNSYFHWDDNSKIEAELKRLMEEKKKNPNMVINAFSHSYGADTLLEVLGKNFNIEEYKGLIDNAVMADPVGRFKTDATKKQLYANARQIVKGRIIDVDAQHHGGSDDTIAGLGKSYDNLLKNEPGITYLVDNNASHASFPAMMEDKHSELGGKSVEDVTFMDRVRGSHTTQRSR